MLEIPASRIEINIFLKELPRNPGVYKFIGRDKLPIYIGKAKNLNNRVASYFQDTKGKSQKIINLIRDSDFLEITITNTELEALLLEQHLIKEIKPKFNVQFKDDKGYPWIKIEMSKEFPTAKSFLGKKDGKESFFGPYPSSYSVKDALSLIQKNFKLRNCSDSYFRNRTRPCLQYEIGRCSAPCVGFITKELYLEEVKSAAMVLEGKSEDLMKDFYSSMDKCALNKSYERAAIYRDKISALRDLQRSQSITGFSKERDALSIISINGITKVGVTHVFKGWITGHENFIQETKGIEDLPLEDFIKSYYLSNRYCPKTIVLGKELSDKRTIENALSQFHKKNIKILTRPGKKDKGLLEITSSNTRLATLRNSNKLKDISDKLKNIKDKFRLNNDIKIIESYDISHHSGSSAVGACVVFSKKGKLKKNYRLYNISKPNSGDDIASMKEVIKRRFSNSGKELEKPSLILIDGGKTHLIKIKEALEDMGVQGIDLIAISKGARRKAEMDSIHTIKGLPINIIKGSISHLLVQEIRDETHKFAISNQKKKQSKLSMSSKIDDIEGVGLNKKRLLLRYFGSAGQIERASIEDLKNVSGIGPKISQLIYNYFH